MSAQRRLAIFGSRLAQGAACCVLRVASSGFRGSPSSRSQVDVAVSWGHRISPGSKLLFTQHATRNTPSPMCSGSLNPTPAAP